MAVGAYILPLYNKGVCQGAKIDYKIGKKSKKVKNFAESLILGWKWRI